MKTSSYRPNIFKDKITIRICALADGSDPRVECETRAAGVTIEETERSEVHRTPIKIRVK
jgi:hypothetical protein